MRRVLHLRTITGKGGGPEKTILNSPGFIGPDYQLQLAFFRPADDEEFDIPQRAAKLGLEIVDLPERGPLDLRALRQLLREIRTFRPHLLHPHDYKTNFLSVLASRWFKIPVVTTVHGYVVRTSKLSAYYRIDRWSLRRMQHVVTVSRDLYDHCLSLGIPAKRCTLIHNAIDSETFRRTQSPAKAKARWGINPSRTVIGAVGRLSPEKGFDQLIRVVGKLCQEGLELELLIAGEGSERPALEQLIRELRCEKRIRLLGHCSNLPALYQAIDIFALSSLREGLPNVVLEALAFEVPTLATRVASVPDVIRHDENGLLITPGNQAELDAGLRRLVAEPQLRTRLAAAGRATIVREFDFHQRMQKMRLVYDQVLGPTTESDLLCSGAMASRAIADESV